MNFFDQIFSSMRGVQGVTAIHNTVQSDGVSVSLNKNIKSNYPITRCK